MSTFRFDKRESKVPVLICSPYPATRMNSRSGWGLSRNTRGQGFSVRLSLAIDLIVNTFLIYDLRLVINSTLGVTFEGKFRPGILDKGGNPYF